MQGKPKGGAIRRFVHKLRVDAHAVWIAARDRRTPLALRLFGALIAAYALSPIDLIPDFVPVLGFVDDLIILPLGIWLFTLMIPKPLWSEYRATAEAETQRPISLLGAAIVVAIWLALAVLIAFAVTNWQYY
ncbi:MAG TPA: YkvA family protein [Rhizorhapis sp.]